GIDDQLAMLHFKMGRCQRSLGRLSEAARSYRRASDLDRIPYGAPTRYNEILRELAARHGALFVDVAARLDRESLGGLVGDDLFADPMHPNLRAHRVIAAAVAQALQAHGLPAPAKQWQPGRYREPDLAAVYEADSELRRRERLIRALTCLLAERPACVRAEAEAVLADQPEDPTARAFLRDLSRPGGRRPRFRE
ncbi:MAG: SGNH/GDSL hydrolase family protein, partial [Myxococcota bacterium]